MTDLMQNLSIYFARLKRNHNAKMSVLSLKGGERVQYATKTVSLFAAETEVWIGGNLDQIGKIDTLEIEESERKRWDSSSDEGREAMEEFMAIVKESVGSNTDCKNLIRKMRSGLQMLNALRAVFVGTSQSRLQQVKMATDNIKKLRLKPQDRRSQTSPRISETW